MKKLMLLLLVPIVLGACALRKPVLMSATLIDYSKFTNQGFFFTESNSVSFEYKPVGSVSALFYSGYELKPGQTMISNGDDVYSGGGLVKTTSKFIPATQQGVVDQLFTEAKKVGANAIINLKTKQDFHYVEKVGYIFDGYSGSGMAVIK